MLPDLDRFIVVTQFRIIILKYRSICSSDKVCVRSVSISRIKAITKDVRRNTTSFLIHMGDTWDIYLSCEKAQELFQALTESLTQINPQREIEIEELPNNKVLKNVCTTENYFKSNRIKSPIHFNKYKDYIKKKKEEKQHENK